GDAQGQDRPSSQDAHIPRARNHQTALRPRRRLHLYARRSRPHLQSHPRTCPPNRSQSRPQTATSSTQPPTRRLPGRKREKIIAKYENKCKGQRTEIRNKSNGLFLIWSFVLCTSG